MSGCGGDGCIGSTLVPFEIAGVLRYHIQHPKFELQPYGIFSSMASVTSSDGIISRSPRPPRPPFLYRAILLASIAESPA